MVKAIVGVMPWAVVLGAIGMAIWWMLSRDMFAGPWLLGALLLGHAMVHLMFAVPAPAESKGGTDWPFDMTRSWAIHGAGLDLHVVRTLGVALIAVVVAGFSLAALSTVGIAVPTGWWQPTVAVAAGASAVLLVVFFEPQLVLGLGIDAVLLSAAVTRAWGP